MPDKTLKSFLTEEYEEVRKFAESSDLVEIDPVGRPPYQRYVISLFGRGLVLRAGEVVEARNFKVGVQIPDDYLRYVLPGEVLMCLEPMTCYHPNINGPFMCVGSIRPGTSLVDLTYQCYEIFGYSNVTMDERDALNPDACRWARENQHRFPIEDRPLMRRSRRIRAPEVGGRQS